MGGKGRPWAEHEDAILRELYPRHSGTWPGWADVLPGRGRWARHDRAARINATGRKGRKPDKAPVAREERPRPRTCGECRFYRNDQGGTGRCVERHAVGLFGSGPSVRASYDADMCEHGEARP